MYRISFIVFSFTIVFVHAQSEPDFFATNPYTEALKLRQWQSVQKYVEVRPGAHILYWLYYADGVSTDSHKKPLIIWIQGGPGLAASGVANFAEIGPLTLDFQPRNHTWVKGHNVLLIDHPVDTGFSYVTEDSLRVKTDREIAMDLVKVIKVFFRQNKEFQTTPSYVFGQSYGGKMTPRVSYYLFMAIENKRLKMNFKGIGIGSGWVDPKESILAMPEYLYNMGIIDRNAYLNSTARTKIIRHYIEKKEYAIASKFHTAFLQYIESHTGTSLNFNNINQANPFPTLGKFAALMNMYVKPTLAHVVNQTRIWSCWSDHVYYDLSDNLLAPSTFFLEALLNKTTLKIAMYNGNLDVATTLAGASNLAHKLRWPGANEFKDATRKPIRGKRNGFYKISGNFSFWSVFGSGHWVPEDNPQAMQQILEYVIGN